MGNGKMRRVFISSPYSGDVERNMQVAKGFLKLAISQGHAPVAPHLLYPQVLDNDDPDSYDLGMALGLKWLETCDEMWVCGDRVSKGMAMEIEFANRHGIPIRIFGPDHVETTKKEEKTREAGKNSMADSKPLHKQSAASDGIPPRAADKSTQSRSPSADFTGQYSPALIQDKFPTQESPGSHDAAPPPAIPTRGERFMKVWKAANFEGKFILVMLLIFAVCVAISFVYSLVTWDWTLFTAIIILAVVSVLIGFAFSSPMSSEDWLAMIWWDMGKKK